MISTMHRRVDSFGRIGFGSANAGNLFTPMSDDEATALFEAAWDAGVRHFDTAPHYGLGLAEERLGRFLRTKPRDEFFLSTKVGRLIVADDAVPAGESEGFVVDGGRRRVEDYSSDGVRRSLVESLERLGLDRVDALHIHDPEEAAEGTASEHLATAIPGCRALKDEGLIGWIGVGSKSVPTLQLAVDHGGIDLVMVAGGFTLLTHPAHPELLETCEATDVAILATAPFNSGLLATHPPQRSSHFDYGGVPEEIFDRAVTLAETCERYGVELPTAALQFGLQYEPCIATVTGAATPDQARETIARLNEPVPAELWAELRRTGQIP